MNSSRPATTGAGPTITSDTAHAGQRAIRMAEDEAVTPWLIYGGQESCERSGVKIFGWRDFPAAIPQP